MKNWYLVLTKVNEDLRAELNLRNQGYCVFRPLIRHTKVRNGKQTLVLESLFPRYLFVGVDVTKNWSKVRSTKGVQGFVRFGELPQIVPDSVVSSVRSYLNGDGIFEDLTAPRFVENCKVRIDRGCFEGCEAIFKAKRGRDRIIVLLNMLNESREIEVSEASVSVVQL